MNRYSVFFIVWILFGFVSNMANASQARALADVVVIVDTSTSMKLPGYDPERTSLLVSKLLSDVVPGELAVVRLLGLKYDTNLLPGTKTGQTVKCKEDKKKDCEMIEPTSDWGADARSKMLGTITRKSRGSLQFKKSLNTHLDQRITNTMFSLAFKAAQGVFDSHANKTEFSDLPKTIIWLSDGKTDSERPLLSVIAELKDDDVNIESIIFGKGDTSLASRANLKSIKVSSPAELMKAFADAFRRIVQAPYKIDNLLSVTPKFEMKPNVDEAWIVVYGDNSLSRVTIEGPDAVVTADYAQENQPLAGAYKVAYILHPAVGQWLVNATNGGVEVAYAVVQRSALTPALLEPKHTTSGSLTTLVVGVRAGLEGNLISDAELLLDAVVTARFQEQTVTLADDGTYGDKIANDGLFSAQVRFDRTGLIPVKIHFKNYIADRTINERVNVSGIFKYHGNPVEIDLGTLKVNAESCRPLVFQAERKGEVPGMGV